jgi:hypothetical protein
MTTPNIYWLTFRLENDYTYQARLERLTNTIERLASGYRSWWEPTSFVVFANVGQIDRVAQAIKAAINPNTDLVLLGMPNYKDARLIGRSLDPSIFLLMPFTKKV